MVNKLNSKVSSITLNRVTGNVEHHDFHKTVTRNLFMFLIWETYNPKCRVPLLVWQYKLLLVSELHLNLINEHLALGVVIDEVELDLGRALR